MNLPKQCSECLNYKVSESRCLTYDYLVGEGTRKDVIECPSYISRTESGDSLKVLAQYIDEDPDQLISQALERAVSSILSGYNQKFKVMVIGIARRKIKSIIKMVDVIDRLIDRVSQDDLELTASQSIRLLSELNNSVNTDLSFIMKLIQPDSTFSDIQVYFDQRTQVLNTNGASERTNELAEKISELSGTSRENIREAFNALLKTIQTDRVSSEPIVLPEEEDTGSGT